MGTSPSGSSTESQVSEDDLRARVQSIPPRIGLLALGLVALLMTWASVSMGAFEEAVTGWDADTGKLYFLLLVLIAAAEYKADNALLKRVWLWGGGGLIVLAGYSYFYIQSAFAEAQAELSDNPFAALVNMEIGLGLYLAIAVGIGVTYVGYQMRPETVDRAPFSC